MSTVKGYCSWCYTETTHTLVEKNYVTRNVYQCSNCKNQTLICRYCSELAKGKPSAKTLEQMKAQGISKFSQFWGDELCAEHDGTISSFKNLTMKLDDISGYKRIFVRDKINLGKGAKIVAAGFSGAALLGGAVWAASKIDRVTEDEPLSHVVMGGCLASTVVTGSSLFVASSAYMGAVTGGVIANRYFSEDKSFNIVKLHAGTEPVNTIFINGFLKQNDTDFGEWLSRHGAMGFNHSLYGVNWASESNLSLGKAFGHGIGSLVALSGLERIGSIAIKYPSAQMITLSGLTALGNLIANPWHLAKVRAEQTGHQVADAISRTEGQKFNLVGHSLGCRVIYFILENLSSHKRKFINDVILLGGAVGQGKDLKWPEVMEAVDGTLYNCHSKQDATLSILYKLGNFGDSDPIGCKELSLIHPRLSNINCDDLVDSHMNWKDHYEDILFKIYGKAKSQSNCEPCG